MIASQKARLLAAERRASFAVFSVLCQLFGSLLLGICLLPSSDFAGLLDVERPAAMDSAFMSTMIHRFDKLATELPEPAAPNANAAAAVQELMGGKFGEMSTIMNYTFQSFNFRGRDKYRPFYDLISNIAAEEYAHIELVAAAVNLLLSGTTKRADRNKPSKKRRP